MRRTTAIAVAAALAASGASAATIDFTDAGAWGGGQTQTTLFGGTSRATTATISAQGGDIAFTPFDGDFAPPVDLDFDLDGAGINGDEITGGTAEVFTVTFGRQVRITGFSFLDLYQAAGTEDAESAFVAFDGGDFSTEFMAVNPYGANAGFAQYMLETPVFANSVSFRAGLGNDAVSQPDFAVAGIEVAPIPLPPSALLLAGALGGFGFLTVRRRSRV